MVSVVNRILSRQSQEMTYAHFTVRRLGRTYGEAFVRAEHERGRRVAA